MQILKREKDLTKNERLEARTTSHVKKMIELAAAIQGRTLTDFMQETLYIAAQNIVKKHEENAVIRLSREESEAFVKALLSPPKPNERLIAAARRYNDRISGK